MTEVSCMKDSVCISKDDVFRQLGCTTQSSAYEMFEEEYEEISETVMRLCRPLILMQRGLLPEKGVPVLYVFSTIGKGPEQFVTESFAQGDCVKGMLADAAADSALFSLEEEISRRVREYCKENSVGIEKRLEAPTDVPMEIQKTVYDAVGAGAYGVGITQGYMFDPVKSSAQVFLLTADTEQMHERHDCAACPKTDCGRRSVQTVRVSVHDAKGRKITELTGKTGVTLLELLQKGDISLAAPCGGRGACGKCQVQVIKGVVPVSKADRRVFGEEQLKNGWRLACCLPVEMNLEILLPRTEENFVVQNTAAEQKNGNTELPETGKSDKKCTIEKQIGEKKGQEEAWGIAIDIGTTTIAMQRVSLATGEIYDTWNGVNHQRIYGTDVITRMDAAVSGKAEELQKMIRRDLADGINALLERSGDVSRMKAAAIAGNTVMIHLLFGYDCSGMTRVPFTPYSLHQEVIRLDKLLGCPFPSVPAYVFPASSSFVGGDITAGLYACGFHEDDRVRMLIDLGTNGEMAIGSRKKLLTASTAAGPAFEGGKITWGMGSLPGAIQGVSIVDGTLRCRTIADAPAQGICGTGVIEACASLYELSCMDETGRLADEFFDKGYPLAVDPQGQTIYVTQQDIREIQLAKAAIRAGIETLLHRFGARAEDIEEICLAGGFGFALDCQRAIEIGLFPEKFAGRIMAAGNSSLAGCVRFLKEYAGTDAFCRASGEGERTLLTNVPQQLTEKMQECELSSDAVFQHYYMEGMMFQDA